MHVMRALTALPRPHHWPTWPDAERTARLWCHTQIWYPGQEATRENNQWTHAAVRQELAFDGPHLCPPVVLFGDSLVTFLTSSVPAQSNKRSGHQQEAPHIKKIQIPILWMHNVKGDAIIILPYLYSYLDPVYVQCFHFKIHSWRKKKKGVDFYLKGKTSKQNRLSSVLWSTRFMRI